MDEATKRCPFCAETVLAAAVVCRFCNRDIPAAARALRNCPDCGGRGEARTDCSACHGDGKARCTACEGRGEIYVGGYGQEYVRCGFCHGIKTVCCDRCAGSGKELENCSTCGGCGQMTHDEFDRIASQRAEEAKRRAEAPCDPEAQERLFNEFIDSIDASDKARAREDRQNLFNDVFGLGVVLLVACAIGFFVYRVVTFTPAGKIAHPTHLTPATSPPGTPANRGS